jgi:hypothetical protein
MAPEHRAAIVAGAEAMSVHRKGLERILAIGKAFAAMQDEAMYRSHSNNPIGKRYNDAYAQLEKPVPVLARINKTDRNQFIWCWQKQAELERWWPTKAQNQRDRWGHPDAVKRHYLADHGEGRDAALITAVIKPPSPVEKLKAEYVRLQEELDAAQAEIRRLKRAEVEALLITRKDTPEQILAVLEAEVPAKAARIAGLLLNRQKSTAPPRSRKRQSEPKAEREWDDA